MRWSLLAVLFLVATSATASEDLVAPTPAIIITTGGATANVDLPGEANLRDASAILRQAQDNIDHVEDGDVSLSEATRDPAETPDTGSSSVFWLFALIVGSVVRPITDAGVSRIRWMDDKLAAAVNTAVVIGLAVLIWILFHDKYQGLPQDLVSWVIAAFSAAGAGAASSSVVKSRGGTGAGGTAYLPKSGSGTVAP